MSSDSDSSSDSDCKVPCWSVLDFSNRLYHFVLDSTGNLLFNDANNSVFRMWCVPGHGWPDCP